MRFASAFSGIEAASSAWHTLGWETAVVIEFDAFTSAVLAHHYPDTPNLGDITQVTEDQIKALGPLDVFVFGSPCQDLSVAGKRKGLEGERSGLFFDAMRLVRWMRQHCGLRWAVWENVPGAFSSNAGADFAAVVAALGGFDTIDVPPKGWGTEGWGTEGAAAGPEALVEWSTLDAQWFGVAQRRRRCFAVADFGDWAGRPPVLLEPDRLRGDSAPSRETGKVAPTIPARSLGGGGLGTDFDCDGGLVRVDQSLRLRCGCGYEFDDRLGAYGCPNCEGDDGPAEPISAVICMAHGQGGAEVRDDGGAPCLTCNHEAPIAAIPATAHTLRGEGFDANEDGTGRGTPLVPVSDVRYAYYSHDYANDRITDVSASGNLNVLAPAIAFDSRQDPVSSDQVFGALGSSSPQSQAVAFAVSLRGREGGGTAELGDEVQNCLRASSGGGDKPHVLTAMQVRRLTPRECERLQGFPDDHTLIPWRKKTADQCPDGPRYKALGNSMAVPVMRWIGHRIEFAHLYF